MNHFKLLIITGLFGIVQTINAQEVTTKAAISMIERVAGKTKFPIQLHLKQKQDKTYYSYTTNNGSLTIEGNTPVALCKGFYDFVKSNGYGVYSWSGNNIYLPKNIKVTKKKEVISPFRHHYYFNVCTFGYSMPYWNWERWEKEIDWMALHGIDMPLALVGYEAIITRVWKKMGLTEEEINKYFVGPAHLPWLRMGNICNIDGPLNKDWHQQQIELQHKILKRMKSLGMKPICMGFPGFIPLAFKRLYPNLKIIKTHWGGAFHNWMISPEEELFSTINTEYIKEWEKEFGKNNYYLIDSFNEMEIPFPAKGSKERKELVASYGEKIYQSIKKGNPDAVWVMQGWMFGYQRNIWDYETLGALLSKVPDNKMLLLDLAVDYNKLFWKSQVNWEFYKGFFNKPWVYSVIPNMGGKTGMTGVLDFYANGHLEALQSPNKRNLIAHGMAPEGIENNEVIYELLSDAGWSDHYIDVKSWLKNYSLNRYGSYPRNIEKYWNLLQTSVYGTFTDHPRFNWQLRPGRVRQGTMNLSDNFFKAIESYVDASAQLKEAPLYLTDLSELMALYLGGKAEFLTRAINWQYEIGDTIQAEKLEKDFEYLLLGIDKFLSSHPNLKLEKWIHFAHKHAKNKKQRQQYETNAKRIVTIWGPPVDDYSARLWSGLVRDYYLPRWKHYFESRKNGEKFNFTAWERHWVESTWDAKLTAKYSVDRIKEAKALINYTKFITPSLYPSNKNDILGTWRLNSKEKTIIKFNIPAEKLEKIKGVRIHNSSNIALHSIMLITDGKLIINDHNLSDKYFEKKVITYPFQFSSDIHGNNGIELQLELENYSDKILKGNLAIVY